MRPLSEAPKLTLVLLGIHGRPYRSWSGVKGVQASGYCTHSSILFPTWHRPYLALFEVSIVRVVE